MELRNSEWNDKAIFLTLTYNNENLPEDRSCHIKEISDYNKALRQSGLKFRFFACSEYGDDPERLTFFGDNVDPELVKRPHYHIVYFGLDNSLSTREILYRHWKKCDSWKFFGRTWYKTVGDVTPDSCGYVAGYCQKKLFGEQAEKEYGEKEAPRQLQSLGIGEAYFLEHYEQFAKDGFIFFNGSYHPIPETWKRKYEIKPDSDRYFEIMKMKVDDFNEKNPNCYIDFDKFKNEYLSAPINLRHHVQFMDYIGLQEPNSDYQYFIDFQNNLRKRGVSAHVRNVK